MSFFLLFFQQFFFVLVLVVVAIVGLRKTKSSNKYDTRVFITKFSS